jgi:hypothetical protein
MQSAAFMLAALCAEMYPTHVFGFAFSVKGEGESELPTAKTIQMDAKRTAVLRSGFQRPAEKRYAL